MIIFYYQKIVSFSNHNLVKWQFSNIKKSFQMSVWCSACLCKRIWKDSICIPQPVPYARMYGTCLVSQEWLIQIIYKSSNSHFVIVDEHLEFVWFNLRLDISHFLFDAWEARLAFVHDFIEIILKIFLEIFY